MSESTHRETEAVTPDDVDRWLIEPEVDRPADELEELAKSLSEGQEEPITLRETDDGLQGVNGYWRVQAVDQYGDQYGVESLTAVVRDMARFEAARARLVTDVFHEPDTFMDMARLVSMVHENFDSQGETADYIGKSRTWVSKKLNRLSDPEPVQEAGEEGKIGENVAAELSEAHDDSPEAVQEAINYADENPEATDADVSEALQEAREADRDTTTVRELTEKAEALKSDVRRLEGQVETREELQADREELEEKRQDIRTELPESQAREYEAFQESQDTVSAMSEAVDVVDATLQQLEESAENEGLTDGQESELTAIKGDLRSLQEEFGQPTYNAVFGDAAPVTVQETKGYNPEFPSDRSDGMELWTFRVVVDPDDIPDPVQAFRDSLEEYAEKAQTAADYAGRIQRAENLRSTAGEIRSQVGEIFDLETFDQSALNHGVVEAISEHSGKTLEEFKNALEEAREEAEGYDTEALEEAYSEYQEAMDTLDSISDSIREIEADIPPQNVAANLSQKETALEEAREEAREAFDALPEETREGLAETLQSAYDGVDWLAGEEAEEADICGVETSDGTPCQNPAGSCPHHSQSEEEAAA